MDSAVSDIRILENIQKILNLSIEYSDKLEIWYKKLPRAGMDVILRTDCQAPYTQANIEVDQFKTIAREKKYGLKVVGGATFKTDESLDDYQDFPDEENDDWYLGLNWDLLKEGFTERKHQADSLEKKEKIQKILFERDKASEIYYCTFKKIVTLFHLQKLNLLKTYRNYLSEVEKASRKLYYLGYIYIDDLLDIRKKQKRIEIRVNQYQRFFRNFHINPGEDIDELYLPAFQIDINLLVDSLQNDEINDRIVDLEKEIIDNKYAILNEIRFRLFAYHHRRGSFGGDSRGITYGFRGSIPLPFPTYRKLKKKEKNLVEIGEEKRLNHQIARLMEVYYDFNYKMEDIVKLWHQKEKFEEKLRRNHGKARRDRFHSDPMHVHNLITNLYDIEFELLEAKEKLYLRFLKISSISGLPNIKDFLVKAEPEGKSLKKIRTGVRSVYMWSDSFNKTSNSKIFDFLSVKTVEKILVSFSEEIDIKKLEAFTESAKYHGVDVHLLLSTTQWIFPDRRTGFDHKIQRMRGLLGNLSGIHLDIEPHILEDWNDKKNEYLELFVNFLDYVSTRYEGHVSISIPVFFPKTFLYPIFDCVDQVYVMAYGIRSVSRMNRLIEEELEAGANKITLALRCSDFGDELEFEEFVETINDSFGIERFAIYDYKQYMDLVKKK